MSSWTKKIYQGLMEELLIPKDMDMRLNTLGKHPLYTELLINEFHQQSKHLGISTTIAKIRMAGFWIPQA